MLTMPRRWRPQDYGPTDYMDVKEGLCKFHFKSFTCEGKLRSITPSGERTSLDADLYYNTVLHYITMLAAGGRCVLIWSCKIDARLGWKDLQAWENGDHLAWERAGVITSLQTWRHLQGFGGWGRVSVGPLNAALVWWNASSMALDPVPLHENCLPVDTRFGGTLGTMTQAHYLRPGVATPSLHGTTRVMTF
ncbi:hypothetical protein DV515_00005251 [Chloebia gouldiae]|uniref:Uncharacterized protein n=1 Tax=Chloebia gouldiae TaxID=44316 RepID=A0A3L8SNA8_CHLGU|nr:hypothetical protein DV515_00005251 [Chloebia gouldiae]